jgi:hypothetical protein
MQTPFACALKIGKEHPSMQTHSFSFGVSLFPRRLTQQTQTQRQITVNSDNSRGNDIFVRFNGKAKNSAADVNIERDRYRELCRQYDIDVNAIEQEAESSDRVKNADSKYKSTYRNREQLKLFRQKYKEILVNASGEYDALGDSE